MRASGCFIPETMTGGGNVGKPPCEGDAGLGREQMLQPLNFASEFEPQLVALFGWKPVRHLRKYDFVIFEGASVPRAFGRCGLCRCQDFKQLLTHLFAIRLKRSALARVLQADTKQIRFAV